MNIEWNVVLRAELQPNGSIVPASLPSSAERPGGPRGPEGARGGPRGPGLHGGDSPPGEPVMMTPAGSSYY